MTSRFRDITTVKQLQRAWRLWYKGQKNWQRFGQYLVNTHVDSKTAWPELFYATDATAFRLALKEILNERGQTE